MQRRAHSGLRRLALAVVFCVCTHGGRQQNSCWGKLSSKNRYRHGCECALSLLCSAGCRHRHDCRGTMVLRLNTQRALHTHPYQLVFSAWRATLFYAMEASQITRNIILKSFYAKEFNWFLLKKITTS